MDLRELLTTEQRITSTMKSVSLTSHVYANISRHEKSFSFNYFVLPSSAWSVLNCQRMGLMSISLHLESTLCTGEGRRSPSNGALGICLRRRRSHSVVAAIPHTSKFDDDSAETEMEIPFSFQNFEWELPNLVQHLAKIYPDNDLVNEYSQRYTVPLTILVPL